MSMKLHINNVCWLAYSELRLISTIWHLLSVDSTKMLVSAFVFARLDYCNSLLSGCPKHLEKLQKVQNSVARLVLKALTWDVSPLLRTLHWLPIQAHTKLSTLSLLFFLIQLLFICLTFSMSILHQDSSAPPLTQELYAFRTQRPKHLDIVHFPCRSFCLEFSASWN